MIVIDSCTAVTAIFTGAGVVLSGAASWAVAWWFYIKRPATPLTREEADVAMARIAADVSKATIRAREAKWMTLAIVGLMIAFTLIVVVADVARLLIQC